MAKRRKSRGPKTAVAVIAVVIGLVLQHYGLWDGRLPELPWVQVGAPTQTVPAEGEYLVERVVDGDTLVLQGDLKIRLIGVDTPETKHPDKPVEPFGPEASEFTRRAAEGRRVTLQFDRERYDRYQRLLAYVYIDGECLNEAIIRAGMSPCVTKYPFDGAMKQRFLAAEAEARNQRRGIWSHSTRLAGRAESR